MDRSTPSTSPTPTTPGVVVWTDQAHATLVGDTLAAMGDQLEPVGIAGPRDGRLLELGETLGCPVEPDLRKLIAEHEPGWVWLAADELPPLRGLGKALEPVRVLTLEPLRDHLEQAVEPTLGAVLSPVFVESPGFRSAADPRQSLGDARLVHFESVGRPGEGSLFARLFDAWQTVLGFTELPETVHATITRPGESPRDVAGHCAVHARMPDGGITLSVSDRATLTARRLTVVGSEASLHVSDGDYQLALRQSEVAETPGPRGAQRGPTFVELVADHWTRLLDLPTPTVSTEAAAEALACIAACQLSARTRQPESPAKLRRLTG